MPDFRSAERMQIDGWVALPQVAQQIFVPFELQRWMIAALHQDLIAPKRDRLLDFLVQLFARQDVSVGVVRLAIEGAEIADSGANVGVVDVPIDVVSAVWLRMQPAAH